MLIRHTGRMQLKRLLRHYWKFARRYPISGILMLTTFGGGVLLSSVAIPLIYKMIIDAVENAVSPEAAAGTLLSIFLLYALLRTVEFACWRSGDFAMSYFESNALRDLANYAFRELLKHSYGFFSNQFAGALIVRSRRFVDGFERLTDYVAFEVFMHGLELIASFFVLLWFSTLLGGVYLVWLVFYMCVMVVLIRYQTPKNIAAAEANSATGARLADVVANVLTLKVFSAFAQEVQTFEERTSREEMLRRRAWFGQNYSLLAQGTLTSLFEMASLGIAIYLWTQGSITAGTIVLTQLYLSNVGGTVRAMGRSTTKILQVISDAQEMVDVLELAVEVKDPEKSEACKISRGAIEMKQVRFAYGAHTPIFNDFSIAIASGEKVGFVGHSGAGKTTVTKLLLRFLDVQSGSISIDGQDIRSITQDDLRRSIGYVPQEPLLFHRTLKENIAYGKPEATDAEIRDAARRAHADEFIAKLPLGYETMVGERGIKLSGGERQRIAIARVMLKDAPILLLDEATSSLDSVSEMHIQAALDEVMKGRTTLVIAHRLSTIRKMDRILVFEDGKITEEGPHENLIARGGVYSELWDQQSGGFIADATEIAAAETIAAR